jgi:hypothetical protein
MLSDSHRSDLLEHVVANTVGDKAQVEWLKSDQCSAHARLQSATGLVAYLLTSPEWQEARFEEPHRSTFLIADSDDEDDVRRALERLARAVTAYLSGDYEVQDREDCSALAPLSSFTLRMAYGGSARGLRSLLARTNVRSAALRALAENRALAREPCGTSPTPGPGR